MDLNYTLLRQLKKLLITQDQLLQQEEKELKELPKGSLVVRKRGAHFFYGQLIGPKEKGITKDKLLVFQLTRKQFLHKALRVRKKNIYFLKECISNISKAIDSEEIIKDTPIAKYANYSIADYNWMKSSHSQNKFNQENLIYKTHSGITVRSKSERIIADRLFHHGVVFRYEPMIILLGKEVYPDFVIRRTDGEIIIWEHNGLMDDTDYAYRAFEKIQRYNAAGYVQHKNLICTTERDILDDKSIDDIIFKFILC